MTADVPAQPPTADTDRDDSTGSGWFIYFFYLYVSFYLCMCRPMYICTSFTMCICPAFYAVILLINILL